VIEAERTDDDERADGVEREALMTGTGGTGAGEDFTAESRGVGRSGKVVELGAGLGEGICLRDSREALRSADAEGKGERSGGAGLSIRLSTARISIERDKRRICRPTTSHELKLCRRYKSNW